MFIRNFCGKEELSVNKWKKYAIMHKDRKVASINSDGSCTIYYPAFMPYNLYLEMSDDFDDRINNLVNFYAWCSSRVLTLDRKYAKEILNALGLRQASTDKERAEIAVSYHCVSMMDVFWVNGYRENISFSEVNIYNHSLSDFFVDVSLRGKSLTAENSRLITPENVAPDIGTPGVAPKAWVRTGNSFKLLKDGQVRDVSAEILASMIIDCFDIEHVKYEEEEFDGQPVSACHLITNEERSIVSAEYVEIYAANHNMKLSDIVFKKSFKAYHMMNIVDYLVGNSDRHWGNWGFWVDNRNNKLESLYPLMDFDRAFTAYSDLDGAMCLPENSKITQKEAALNAVRLVGLNQIKEIDRAWFYDENIWRMFNRRLRLLNN